MSKKESEKDDDSISPSFRLVDDPDRSSLRNLARHQNGTGRLRSDPHGVWLVLPDNRWGIFSEETVDRLAALWVSICGTALYRLCNLHHTSHGFTAYRAA